MEFIAVCSGHFNNTANTHASHCTRCKQCEVEGDIVFIQEGKKPSNNTL